jgi:hypothetical protein
MMLGVDAKPKDRLMTTGKRKAQRGKRGRKVKPISMTFKVEDLLRSQGIDISSENFKKTEAFLGLEGGQKLAASRKVIQSAIIDATESPDICALFWQLKRARHCSRATPLSGDPDQVC